MPDMGVERFIHYRIDPAFLQMTICLQMNLDRWNSLHPEARKILLDQAAIYERASRIDFFALQDREIALLETRGLHSAPVAAEYAERYRALAREVVWGRMAARVPESAARLRPLFDPETGR